MSQTNEGLNYAATEVKNFATFNYLHAHGLTVKGVLKDYQQKENSYITESRLMLD
jgi:hypothetical protein